MDGARSKMDLIEYTLFEKAKWPTIFIQAFINW